MRILLLYPPPWKIPAPGEARDPVDGPPKGFRSDRIDDGDFIHALYGLLSLAAQALHAGHDVITCNLSNFAWREVETLVRRVRVDLVGLSCVTPGRRGAAAIARLVREIHPRAHIVMGGPHVTALPQETLAHYREVDTVVMGEGEETFMELIHRLETGRSTKGLAGTAWREGDDIKIGPTRPRIKDIDRLIPPTDYFPTPILVTTRGCPGRCTFCGSQVMWGRRVAFHSSDYVLHMIETVVRRHRLLIIAIKDDTFTLNRDRVLAVCEGIRKRGLNFIWSCDTRVDCLDEELLKAMRVAGCQRISLGVESGSPTILKNIKKQVTTEKIIEATRMAQKFGFEIRYYLMWGNQGETLETIRESIDFIEQARPSSLSWSLHTVCPGTESFTAYQQHHQTDANIFFEDTAPALLFFAGPPEEKEMVEAKVKPYKALTYVWEYSLEERRAILKRLPGLPAAHMDLAEACYRAGELDETEVQVRTALDMGYPLPAIGYNYLACIAAARGDFGTALGHLYKASTFYPHPMVIQNQVKLHAWYKAGGPQSGRPLNLTAHSRFEMKNILQQPITPGEIIIKTEREDNEQHLGSTLLTKGFSWEPKPMAIWACDEENPGRGIKV